MEEGFEIGWRGGSGYLTEVALVFANRLEVTDWSSAFGSLDMRGSRNADERGNGKKSRHC